MRLSLVQKLENSHDDSIWTAAWAPGANTLVTGSVDESVKLWSEHGDGAELQQMHVLSGVALGAVSVAVDSTGAYGAVASLDSSINVWRMADYTPPGPALTQAPSETWGVAFLPRSGPDDKVVLAVAGGSANTVRLVDVLAGEQVLSMRVPVGEGEGRRERFVLCVAASPDGQRLAASAMDGKVAVFDTATGTLLHRLLGHFKPVRCLTFTPDSKQLLSACDDMQTNMYDVQGGALIEAFSGHESWVLSVAAHPGGGAFATGGSDGKVRLWDLATRSCAQVVGDHGDQVWAVAFREDGARLATVSDDRSICLYDCA